MSSPVSSPSQSRIASVVTLPPNGTASGTLCQFRSLANDKRPAVLEETHAVRCTSPTPTEWGANQAERKEEESSPPDSPLRKRARVGNDDVAFNPQNSVSGVKRIGGVAKAIFKPESSPKFKFPV